MCVPADHGNLAVEKNMKILQINCVYGRGSTGKITKDIHTGLIERGYESSVIYGRGVLTDDINVTRIGGDLYGKFNNLISRFTGVMYGACNFSTARIISRIKKEKPDVVHLQCINGYFCNIFRLLDFLKKSKIPTVLTLHAEFMYTANCGHAGTCDQWINGCRKCPRLRKETKSLLFDRTGYSWKRMQGIYKDWQDLVVVGCSDWICSRVKQCGEIKNSKIVCLHNGIDNDSIFYPRSEAKARVYEKYNIDSDKKTVLFVAPGFTHLKGFDRVCELASVCEDLPFQFVLVGGSFDTDKKNITVVGKVTDQNHLAEIYSAADVLVMCSRNENYPTVCVEATSCGTPVVGFDVGGVKETIPSGMGYVVESGNVLVMKEKIIEVVHTKPDDETVESARNYHSKKRMIEQYIEIYEDLANERHIK